MPEGIDDAAGVFSAEISPKGTPQIDHRGKAVEVVSRPEPIFSPRAIEGDEFTGDTRDGGDDLRLRAREREIADGRFDERQDRWVASRSRQATSEAERQGSQRRRADAAQRHDASADDGHSGTEIEPEDFWADGAADAADAEGQDSRALAEGEGGRSVDGSGEDAEGEGGEGSEPRYELTVDGQTHHVTLTEALNGYVRQATFHQRMTQLNQRQQELDNDAARQHQNWSLILKAKQDYEQDLANLIPKEPDWDREFAVNPQNAHATQKIFQTLYNKLYQSRAQRAQYEAHQAAENDRRVHKYAVEGFSKFVMDNKIPDEKTLNRELQSMRRTAAATGFNEYEVATVYDPRMLTILRKASRYDRMMATRPQAVIPGKGKALTPGAATPLGNVRRSGFDDAQRRLAQSGKLSDAVDVFRRML